MPITIPNLNDVSDADRNFLLVVTRARIICVSEVMQAVAMLFEARLPRRLTLAHGRQAATRRGRLDLCSLFTARETVGLMSP